MVLDDADEEAPVSTAAEADDDADDAAVPDLEAKGRGCEKQSCVH